jgi:hypothetical protein
MTGLFLVTSIGIYLYREQPRIPIILKGRILSSRQFEKKEGCCLTARIGPKYSRIEFAICWEDQREKEELVKKLPSIRHELSMSATRPDLALAIEQRNFEAIRKHLRLYVRPILWSESLAPANGEGMIANFLTVFYLDEIANRFELRNGLLPIPKK